VGDWDGVVRGAALEAIAAGWASHPDTPALLRDRALADPNPNGRGGALRALDQALPRDPANWELLRERAVTDPVGWVRGVAAQVLAERRQRDPAVAGFLRARALADPDDSARGVLLWAIARNWPADAASLALLRERAVADPRPPFAHRRAGKSLTAGRTTRGRCRSAIVAGYAQTHAAVTGLEGRDAEQAASSLLAWLASTKRSWLVVLDDLTDPGDLRDLWPPHETGGRTMVTTRRRDAALSGSGRTLIDIGDRQHDGRIPVRTATRQHTVKGRATRR
jgi:hypothetical protein